MRLLYEEKLARQRARRAEWRQQIVALKLQQIEKQRAETNPEYERRFALGQEKLNKVYAMLEGDEFRRWFEATTGESRDEWLAEVYEERDQNVGREGFIVLDWLQAKIEILVSRHPWSNPDAKALWSAEVLAAKTARERRRALLRLATPTWADPAKVMAVYEERDRLTEETGVPHDVDHIVPIVHPKVCGLHCEFNLRVVPASVNRRKSNSLVAVQFDAGVEMR